jgi:hypothetical protein
MKVLTLAVCSPFLKKQKKKGMLALYSIQTKTMTTKQKEKFNFLEIWKLIALMHGRDL